MFVEVWLPEVFDTAFTYVVPDSMKQHVKFGIRVTVPFQKRITFAIVERILPDFPLDFEPKEILEIPDNEPVVNQTQFNFWKWLASYYQVPFGLVLRYCLPKAFSLKGETVLYHNPEFNAQEVSCSDEQLMVLDALELQGSLKLKDLKAILPNLNKPTTFVQNMYKRKMLLLEQQFSHRYKEKTIKFAGLLPEYLKYQNDHLKALNRSPRQKEIIDYLLTKENHVESFNELFKTQGFSKPSLRTLIKKEWVSVYEQKVDRELLMANLNRDFNIHMEESRIDSIKDTLTNYLDTNEGVLCVENDFYAKLQVYKLSIEQALKQEKDVLFLIPDMLLYPQYYSFFKTYFKDDIIVYHNQFSEQERVEIWRNIQNQSLRTSKIIISTKIGIFLPFHSLSLIIVDDESDPIYKQAEIAPLYQAKDMSFVLQSLHKCPLILSAIAPSLESWKLLKLNKIKCLEVGDKNPLSQEAFRFIDINAEKEQNNMVQHLSKDLIFEIDVALQNRKQVLIYKDRRGYASKMECKSCHYIPRCVHCSVNLTYHKSDKCLRCHQCGYQRRPTYYCDQCSKPEMEIKGYGTERILEELRSVFIKANVVRLDRDTLSTKNKLNTFIDRYDSGEIDILIGTRMISKGLDLSNTAILVVVLADDLLMYPDFRVEERALQSLSQISQRLLSQSKDAQVIIQTYQKEHPVFRALKEQDPTKLYSGFLKERQDYMLPPYTRMILINFRHKNSAILFEATAYFYEILIQKIPSKRARKPYTPSIERIRTYYQMQIDIQLIKNARLKDAKTYIQKIINKMSKHDKFRSVMIRVDVDPNYV